MTQRIRNTIRDTKRFAEVLGVLARHGFQEFFDDSGLDGLITRGLALVGRRGPAEETTKLPRAERGRLILEELGPTFIKLGQILSTRPDLVPPAFVEEFRRLQDDCPRVPYEEIRERLEEEFGDALDEIFRSIDETPLAAASMAQAHRAVLADGTPVVIKVLRPGIEEIIEADLGVLRELARLTDSRLSKEGFSPLDVVAEFSRQLRKEIDFSIEGKSTDRLDRHFRDNPEISFPRVYHDASTKRVLTLELIEGRILSQLDPEELAPELRRRVIQNGADAVFDMCLDFGFFHADPHPGNIFMHADGSITFIDCGMTGQVEPRTTTQLARLIQAVVSGNSERVIQVALDLTGADPSLGFDRAFRHAVSEYTGGFQVVGGSLEGLDLGAMLHGLFELLRTWQIRCPSDLVFLIKALATIEGVGREIDPTFDLVGHVKPKLERLVRRRYGPTAVRRRVLNSLGSYVDIVEELPADLRTVLAQVRREGFTVNLRHRGLEGLAVTMDRASGTIAHGLLLAAVIVGSSLLVLADSGREGVGILSLIGFAGLLVVTAIVLVLAGINFWRGRRRKWK